MSGPRTGVVVVGVDGSAASVTALEHALDLGAHEDLAIEVVTVWSWPDPFEPSADREFPHTARDRALRAQTEAVTLARRGGAAVGPDDLTFVLAEGDPRDLLVRASVGAHCLVLGAPRDAAVSPRGVRDHCVRAAACPVLVVPEKAWDGDEPAGREGLRHVAMHATGARS